MAIKPPVEKHARRSKRFENDSEVSKPTQNVACINRNVEQNKIKQEADESNKELKRLQFYGAGPKMAGYNVGKKDEKPRTKSINYEFDPVSELFSSFRRLLLFCN